MTADVLAPLPVLLPLAAAALLLGLSKLLPGRVPDAIATAVAIAAACCCAALARAAASGPVVTWFGGWHVLDGQVIGISFVADMASAGFAAVIALLFAATLVFAWGFFRETNAHFHVLMLAFMAGMIGFCLSGDLFNMFVWFELMSVAGFAATAFALRPSAISGALNFTVVNTIGAYLFLAGIALLYGKLGALDLATLGQRVAAAPDDTALRLGFALIAAALLTKAAQVPFQMWLADAHAVAPSPVSVVFSGAMVGIAVFGLAKIGLRVFGGAPPALDAARVVLLAMGSASALVGGLMALAQRHIKRLLAFSTISHVGIMLIGAAQFTQAGLAGLLSYLCGHGAVKGAMFMLAGFVAARCGGVDEVDLRGRGRRYWPVGLLMAAGGLMLAGLPLGTMAEGHRAIEAAAADYRFAGPVILVAAATTGAAVLRVAGRVFAGWGERAGDEAQGESEQEEEDDSERPLSLLVGPALLLLVLGAVGWDGDGQLAARAAASLMQAAPVPPPPSPSEWAAWAGVAAAVAIAAFDLGRGGLPRAFTAAVDAVRAPPTRVLQAMQSGLVTDYVAWMAVGLAILAGGVVLG